MVNVKLKEMCEEGYESERLRYRKLTVADVSDMYEYASDEGTCFFLKWGPYKHIDEARCFVMEKIKNYEEPTDVLYAIELKKKNKMIGIVRVYNITNNTVDISYIQNPLFCKNGYNIVHTGRRMLL